jgi:hypothetical protein
MAHHSRMAQPRMAAGCWVDAWLAHAMKQSATMLVALTSAVHCWHHRRPCSCSHLLLLLLWAPANTTAGGRAVMACVGKAQGQGAEK